MLSFDGKRANKSAALARAKTVGVNAGKGRQREDLFWSQAAWCDPAVKCTKEGCTHRFYTDEYHIPEAIAYGERALFLALTPNRARRWTARFCGAVPVGVDVLKLNCAWRQLALTILRHPKYGMLQCAYTHAQENAILNIIKLYEADNFEDEDAWKKAIDAAYAAAKSTDCSGPASMQNRAQAGSKAAWVAGHLAATPKWQRWLAQALRQAPGALREHWVADYKASHEKAKTSWDSTELDKSARTWQENACTWFSKQLLNELRSVDGGLPFWRRSVTLPRDKGDDA